MSRAPKQAALAIELNDAGIAAVGGAGVLAEEPGYALLDGDALLTGNEARRVARLRPRQVHDRFWSELSLDPLPRATRVARNTADIAYAQLRALWERVGDGVEEVVIALPASFHRERLGLLLGIAQECGLPVRGMVEAPVAASGRAYPGRQLLHLDAGLHEVVLTSLEQGDAVTRSGFNAVSGVGLVALESRWAERIAQAFVAATRFDPLHHAETEQSLYDRLPEWLEALRAHGKARLAVEDGGRTHAAELTVGQLLAATRDLYGAITQLVEGARARGTRVVVQVSHRLSALPGLVDALGTLEAIEIVELDRAAGASGALASIEQVRSPAGGVTMVTRIAWRDAPTPTEIEAREPEATEVELPAAAAGHVSFVRRGARLFVESKEPWPLLLNGEPVTGESAVEAGDVLSIGDPPVELRIVAPNGRGGADGA